MEQYELTCQRKAQLIVQRLWERVWQSPKNGNTLPIWLRHSTTSDSPKKKRVMSISGLAHTYKKFREGKGQSDRQWVFHAKYCKVTFFYQRTCKEITFHWHKQISKGWAISSKEILILVIKPATFSSTEKYLKMNFLCKSMGCAWVIQFTPKKVWKPHKREELN